jgi:hypothetical protein
MPPKPSRPKAVLPGVQSILAIGAEFRRKIGKETEAAEVGGSCARLFQRRAERIEVQEVFCNVEETNAMAQGTKAVSKTAEGVVCQALLLPLPAELPMVTWGT